MTILRCWFSAITLDEWETEIYPKGVFSPKSSPAWRVAGLILARVAMPIVIAVVALILLATLAITMGGGFVDVDD